MRLASAAQRLIGAQTADLIRNNRTLGRVMQVAAAGHRIAEQEEGSFKLKFPPGY
jgi:hypothetical protein